MYLYSLNSPIFQFIILSCRKQEIYTDLCRFVCVRLRDKKCIRMKICINFKFSLCDLITYIFENSLFLEQKESTFSMWPQYANDVVVGINKFGDGAFIPQTSTYI